MHTGVITALLRIAYGDLKGTENCHKSMNSLWKVCACVFGIYEVYVCVRGGGGLKLFLTL